MKCCLTVIKYCADYCLDVSVEVKRKRKRTVMNEYQEFSTRRPSYFRCLRGDRQLKSNETRGFKLENFKKIHFVRRVRKIAKSDR
jgi:hypothetical protein